MSSKIKTALISVSDKDGIVEFAKFLNKSKIDIISTGGTAKTLRDNKIDVRDITELTGFPEIMDGRVKTLHPKVHGGLLGVRNSADHKKAMDKHDIIPIDLLVVNLYPFEETVAKGGTLEDCIENIDIGGPSMIRSAAKNHEFVTVVTDPSDYKEVQKEIKKSGSTSKALRKKLAAKAFARTGAYDSAISAWFAKEQGETFPDTLNISLQRESIMRYGENPHQQAALYKDASNIPSVVTAEIIQGKELSYNNISDTDAAYELVCEFDEPAVAIIKHANPCGVAVGKDLSEAYKKALACDPVSAYGGIFAFNKKLDGKTAELLSKLFVEVIIAPDADKKAKDIIAKKKNLRLLLTGAIPDKKRDNLMVKSVSGGLLLQERDKEILNEKDLKVVTKRKPTKQELKDLKFAFVICKHVKSNAIVLAKDEASVGIGAGQMSRIDSSRIAAWKAKETAESVEDARGSVLASDAFLPFADGLIAAAENGVTAVIQPGGSIRDDEVIKAADEHNIAMIFTGIRHFKH